MSLRSLRCCKRRSVVSELSHFGKDWTKSRSRIAVFCPCLLQSQDEWSSEFNIPKAQLASELAVGLAVEGHRVTMFSLSAASQRLPKEMRSLVKDYRVLFPSVLCDACSELIPSVPQDSESHLTVLIMIGKAALSLLTSLLSFVYSLLLCLRVIAAFLNYSLRSSWSGSISGMSDKLLGYARTLPGGQLLVGNFNVKITRTPAVASFKRKESPFDSVICFSELDAALLRVVLSGSPVDVTIKVVTAEPSDSKQPLVGINAGVLRRGRAVVSSWVASMSVIPQIEAWWTQLADRTDIRRFVSKTRSSMASVQQTSIHQIEKFVVSSCATNGLLVINGSDQEYSLRGVTLPLVPSDGSSPSIPNALTTEVSRLARCVIVCLVDDMNSHSLEIWTSRVARDSTISKSIQESIREDNSPASIAAGPRIMARSEGLKGAGVTGTTHPAVYIVHLSRNGVQPRLPSNANGSSHTGSSSPDVVHRSTHSVEEVLQILQLPNVIGLIADSELGLHLCGLSPIYASALSFGIPVLMLESKDEKSSCAGLRHTVSTAGGFRSEFCPLQFVKYGAMSLESTQCDADGVYSMKGCSHPLIPTIQDWISGSALYMGLAHRELRRQTVRSFAKGIVGISTVESFAKNLDSLMFPDTKETRLGSDLVGGARLERPRRPSCDLVFHSPVSESMVDPMNLAVFSLT